jgi:hypothetical protein
MHPVCSSYVIFLVHFSLLDICFMLKWELRDMSIWAWEKSVVGLWRPNLLSYYSYKKWMKETDTRGGSGRSNFHRCFKFFQLATLEEHLHLQFEKVLLKESMNLINFRSFLGAFCKTATNYYWLHICQSVCPHGTTRLTLDGLSWNLGFEHFF